jgi:hypothetical protein
MIQLVNMYYTEIEGSPKIKVHKWNYLYAGSSSLNNSIDTELLYRINYLKLHT